MFVEFVVFIDRFKGSQLVKVEPLTEKEVNDLREKYIKFVGEEDAILKTDDVGPAIESTGWQADEHDLKVVLGEVDSKGSNELDFSQFLLVYDKLRTSCGLGNVVLASFEEYDRDRDGRVGLDDLRVVMATLGEELTHEELFYMMQEAGSKSQDCMDYEDYMNLVHAKGLKPLERQPSSLSLPAMARVSSMVSYTASQSPPLDEDLQSTPCRAGMREASCRAVVRAASNMSGNQSPTPYPARPDYADSSSRMTSGLSQTAPISQPESLKQRTAWNGEPEPRQSNNEPVPRALNTQLKPEAANQALKPKASTARIVNSNRQTPSETAPPRMAKIYRDPIKTVPKATSNVWIPGNPLPTNPAPVTVKPVPLPSTLHRPSIVPKPQKPARSYRINNVLRKMAAVVSSYDEPKTEERRKSSVKMPPVEPCFESYSQILKQKQDMKKQTGYAWKFKTLKNK